PRRHRAGGPGGEGGGGPGGVSFKDLERRTNMLAQKVQPSVRDITHRTRGHGGGPITRLMSPSDLGEVIKPFVFLDLADFPPWPPSGRGSRACRWRRSGTPTRASRR